MQISNPCVSRSGSGETAITCDLSLGGMVKQAFYRTAVPLGEVGVEPFVCISMIPSLRTGEPVTVTGPVSTKLAGAIPTIQGFFTKWYPDLRPFQLHAAELRPAPAPAGRGVGCCFSGGVDSFYSVLRHADEVDTLVFVHGFDIPLANAGLRARVSAHLRAAAAALGKRLIEVETNVRELLDPFGNWGTHTHGSALASVAHVLSGTLGKLYVPSSASPHDVMPWGSHPAVDPLWSSEAMAVTYDEDDGAARFAKTAFIAKSDLALSHLRVCWENRDNAYNCGRCEKCLRTMMSLRVAGALERCPAFDAPLDLARVARLGITKPARARFYTDIGAAARAAGDHAVAHAVEQALRPPPRRGWLRTGAGRLRRKLLGR